tara:strand:+ start:288 stop:842 length:555 start_codon:yes stop_codon:yes gene_type:complete
MNYIVTGLFCSGKSTFLSIAKKYKFKVLKSDDLVTSYYNDINIINALKDKFKITNFKDNLKIVIKDLFLESEENKEIIESIIHPYVHSKINEELHLNDKLMVEVPAIMKNKGLINSNKSIYIESTNINRLKYYKTKEINDTYFFERINEYQKDYSLIKSCCDIIINNNNRIEDFHKYFDEEVIK